MNDETNLKITYGTVAFETPEPLTIEDVTKLAEAAKIVGIPSDAVIGHLDFRYGYGPTGRGCNISIGWKMI